MNKDSNNVNNLRRVISSGMCIACGACVKADPRIHLEINPSRQIFEPSITGNELAARVCPSVEVDYGALQSFVFGIDSTGPLGVIDLIYLAQSTNYERNREASSGGLIKEVAIHLLKSKIVEGIISIDHKKGLEYVARLVTNPSEIDELPRSVYHNIDLSSVIELIESAEGPVAVIAIPCQLEGIYKYISTVAPSLKSKVVFTIGLLCAWQYTRHSILAISEYSGFAPESIDEVIYRGGDAIGKLRVRLSGGKEHVIDRRANLNYQIAFDRAFNTPRCSVCVNHINYLADLVVGDSWMQSTRFSKTGVSLAVCRSAKASTLFHEMVQANEVVAHKVTENELIESEGEKLIYGGFAYRYSDVLRNSGLAPPKLIGPNYGHGVLVASSEAESYFRKSRAKQKLMASGKYRMLWWRKVLLEGYLIAFRYLRWFVNRALRFKKITGKDKRISRNDLKGFR